MADITIETELGCQIVLERIADLADLILAIEIWETKRWKARMHSRRIENCSRSLPGTRPSKSSWKDGPVEAFNQRSFTMKKVILGSLMAVSLLAGSAMAQVSATIELGQPERTKIKEYVVKEKVKPFTVKEKVVVGGTLPADVELMAVPSDWGPSVSKYRYVYTNDDVVLVDPTTRRVIQIID